MITITYNAQVAPFTGAWIEILGSLATVGGAYVAPFTGAWIEISHLVCTNLQTRVAPFTGAWIEIKVVAVVGAVPGRSLHGSVD